MTPAARRLLHLLEIATVGLPFCVFKLLTGSLLAGNSGSRAAGVALIALGAVDLVCNVANFSLTLAGHESPVAVCLAQNITMRLRPGVPSWQRLGLSIDAMFSFALVATMVGFRLLRRLPGHGQAVWSLCVVLNVLGAGIGRLAESVAAVRTDAGRQASG